MQDTRLAAKPNQTFVDLREWVNARLVDRGLPPSTVPEVHGSSSLEASGVTVADIDHLKADIATLIKLEGRRSFRSGVAVNAAFFVLGILTSVVIDVVKAGGPFLW